MKVLVCADPRSIHAVGFVAMLRELGHDIRMFSAEWHYGLEASLRDVVLHVPLACFPGRDGILVEGQYSVLGRLLRAAFALRPLKRVGSRLLYAIAAPGRVTRAKAFADLAAQWRPDLAISLKMQNEGYTVSRARELGGWSAPWIHFSWGTDMEFFGLHPRYAARNLPLIRTLLEGCDFHIADTQRDLARAKELGFRGITLGDMPATGGFDIAWLRGIERRSQADRDTVLIKGRQGGYVGKALNVFQAIRAEPELYRGLRLRVFMASPEVAAAARALREQFNLDCEVLGRLDHAELMAWYGRSICAVSASDVDGTPGFLLEAMAMGALPVHSDMSSLREWVEHGSNGLLFPVDDVALLGQCLHTALTDPELRQRAAERNFVIIEARVDRNKLREKLKHWIELAGGTK